MNSFLLICRTAAFIVLGAICAPFLFLGVILLCVSSAEGEGNGQV